MFNNTINWIEIRFWNTVIPIMERSAFAKRLVNVGYKYASSLKLFIYPVKLTMWAAAGLSIGILIGLLAAKILSG